MNRGSMVFLVASLVVLGSACEGADGSRGAAGAAGAAGADASPQAASIPEFDAAAAYALLERQLEFGPRIPGTPGHSAQAEWMEAYLAERTDTVIVQRFEHVTVDGDTIPLVNLLARFGPAGAPPVLLVAHWDTRPLADQAFALLDREKPVPGANDGASGTAILLQLADLLSNEKPPRAVDILLVDGEDYGDFSLARDVFIGSRYFARNLPDGYEAEYGVLLDMVGDRDLEIYVEGNSNRLAPGVVDRVWNVARRLGFGDIFRRDVRHTINDDHIPLNDAGIPTADVIDFDYPYWHTPEDTLDKISASSLAVVGTVIVHLVYSTS